jgi:hypothetical protein
VRFILKNERGNKSSLIRQQDTFIFDASATYNSIIPR